MADPTYNSHSSDLSSCSMASSTSTDVGTVERREFYLERLEYFQTEVERLIFGNEPWEICKETRDTTISRLPLTADQNGGGGRHVFRNEFYVNLSVERLSHRMHACSPYRTKWDSQLDYVTTLDQIDPNILVVRHVMKSHLMGLVSARDTIDLVKFGESPKGRFAILGSVDIPEWPHQPGFVRAWCYPTGIFFFHTDDPNRTRVVALFNADVHIALIPVAILEALVPKGCQVFISDLQKAAKLKDEKHAPLLGWN